MKAKNKSLIFTDFETSSLLHEHHFIRVLGVESNLLPLSRENDLSLAHSLLPLFKYDLQLNVANVYDFLSLFME